MELAASGEDMKKLREIAKVHIARCEAGDMQAIKELADRLDGRPAPMLEHSGPDSEQITKVVNEIVHVYETREELLAAEEPVLIEWSGVGNAVNVIRTRDYQQAGCRRRPPRGPGHTPKRCGHKRGPGGAHIVAKLRRHQLKGRYRPAVLR